MNESLFRCRLGTRDDIPAVTHLYHNVYGSVPWTFGISASQRILEKAIESDNNVHLVCESEKGEIVAACLGSTNPDKFASAFWRHDFIPMWSAIGTDVLTTPRHVIKLARLLRREFKYTLRRQLRPNSIVDHPVFSPNASRCRLDHFMVHPDYRGNRIGYRLIQTFEGEMRSRGLGWCEINTTTDNIASQRTQERAGYQQIAIVGKRLVFLRDIRFPHQQE